MQTKLSANRRNVIFVEHLLSSLLSLHPTELKMLLLMTGTPRNHMKAKLGIYRRKGTVHLPFY